MSKQRIKALLFLPVILIAPGPVEAGAQTPMSMLERVRFVTDTASSSVEFSVRFMGLRRVFGSFRDFDGTVWFDPSSPENSRVAFSVKVASVDTENNFRDADLSDNWFEAEKYPESTFSSDSIRPGEGSWLVFGKLALKGVTRDIQIPVTLHRTGPDDPIHVRGRFTIDRMVYGVDDDPTSNAFFDASRMIVGDDVLIILDLLLKSEEPGTAMAGPGVTSNFYLLASIF